MGVTIRIKSPGGLSLSGASRKRLLTVELTSYLSKILGSTSLSAHYGASHTKRATDRIVGLKSDSIRDV
jgi:hypothetical protein